MSKGIRNTITAVVLLGAAVGGVVYATGTASGEEDGTEVPITGEPLEKASAAALAYTGGGRVTETEFGDEDSLYEVEVTLDDGRQIDVQLDADFNVVSAEPDDEEQEGDDD